MKKYILIILIGLILLGLIITIILLLNKSSNSRNENINTNSNPSYFENTNIKFNYPSSYGAVETKISEISTDKSVNSGKAFGITFEDNKDISITLASSDFRTFLNEIYLDTNKKFKDICPVTIVNNNGSGCRIRSFGSREVLEQTEYNGNEGTYFFFHTYSFLLNNKEYAYLTLSQNFMEIYEKLNPLQYGKEDITDQEREKIINEYAQSIINNQTKGNMKSQIEEVENIISSLVEI